MMKKAMHETFENFEKNILSQTSAFHNFFWILRSWSKTHMKINFGVEFCSRHTYATVQTFVKKF